MRNLNLDEIIEKISDYAEDIKYCDQKYVEDKMTQFFNFLFKQPISKRTLDRISEDFKDLNRKVIEVKSENRAEANKNFIKSLSTQEIQGAFAYFVLKNKFESKSKNLYIGLANSWYTVNSTEYAEWQKHFNNYIFKPFIELIKWYFRESKIKKETDYFSREEIKQIENNNFETLTNQIKKLECGQNIIFDEADEIKGLITGLNKKNWLEVIKGKFNDMILKGLINLQTAELLIKTITGEDINLK